MPSIWLLAACALFTFSASHAQKAQVGVNHPLVPGNWSPIGPGPSVDTLNRTGYTEPSSGRIVAVAGDPIDPDTLYIAAAGGGVWKTIDGGNNWAHLTDTQSTLFMGAIAVAPNDRRVIYAGTGEAHMGPSKAREARDNIYYGLGVLKSTNGGDTWSLLGNTDTRFKRRTISKIVVDPTTPDTVYVAVGALATNGLPGNTGIWKSTDGGVSWRNTTEGTISTTAAFSDLVIDPDPVNRLTLYAAVGTPGGDVDNNGVYQTTDGGASWVRVEGFPFGDARVGRITLAIANTTPRKLYAAIALPGPPNSMTNSLFRLLRKTEGQPMWDVLLTSANQFCPSAGALRNYMAGAGDYHNTLAVDPVNPNFVFAAGICPIRSKDGGDTWEPDSIASGERDGPHRDHHALVFDANNRLLNGNDGGIWRLNNPREEDPTLLDWANLNGNLQITQFVGIALHPTDANTIIGGTQDTGTARYEGVLQWPRLLRGDGGASAISPVDPTRVFQVTRITSTASLFRRSDDGGESWMPKDPVLDAGDHMNFYFPVVMDPQNPDRLLLGTTRVLETIDAADTWSPISLPGTNGWPACTVCDNIDSLALAPIDGKVIYASAGGHIFVTINAGATWVQRDVAGLTNPHFRALTVDRSLAAYAVRDRFDGGHVFRTTNGDAAWTDISGDLPNLPVNAIVVDSTTLYVGNDNGVYVSTNQGASWSRFGTDLPNVQIIDLKLNTSLNILAAGTHGRGVWKTLIGP